ncbi:MAG TPA: hypothetical protein VKV74_07720 [Bryobacteraceae bacterium]|nr:hypothetical protein [Bryobacteraceae bacterium]
MRKALGVAIVISGLAGCSNVGTGGRGNGDQPIRIASNSDQDFKTGKVFTIGSASAPPLKFDPKDGASFDGGLFHRPTYVADDGDHKIDDFTGPWTITVNCQTGGTLTISGGGGFGAPFLHHSVKVKPDAVCAADMSISGTGVISVAASNDTLQYQGGKPTTLMKGAYIHYQ